MPTSPTRSSGDRRIGRNFRAKSIEKDFASKKNARLWQERIVDNWVAGSEEKCVFRKGLAGVEDLEVPTLAVSHPSGARRKVYQEESLVKELHAFLEAHGPDVPNVP